MSYLRSVANRTSAPTARFFSCRPDRRESGLSVFHQAAEFEDEATLTAFHDACTLPLSGDKPSLWLLRELDFLSQGLEVVPRPDNCPDTHPFQHLHCETHRCPTSDEAEMLARAARKNGRVRDFVEKSSAG